ncbi:MAG: 30S ribosomal protein S13 [Chloroflexi bacterium]|nr:30S ribosomal protein S13 [Chloroflexota bacterium]
MARIAGVDLPPNKKIEFSLAYLYGIGPRNSRGIVSRAGVNPDTRTKDLKEDELARIRDLIDKEFRVEGELRKEVSLNIKKMVEIGAYRGLRHRRGLPVHGQRTRTNARTRRGARKTVAGRGRKPGAKK